MKILKGSPKYFELTASLAANQPLYLMLNLETPCRYCCPKCALPGCGCGRAMGTPLSLTERKRIIQLAHEIGVVSLVIVGAGEPTDRRGFPIVQPVVEYAAELGMVTILFTTLYGLTRQQAEFYKSSNVSLYISLDSLNPTTYRKLTGNGKLERIISNIAMLREMYRPESTGSITVVRLGINTTVVKQNLAELEIIRQFAGNDIHFVANCPIRRGQIAGNENWEELVGNDYETLVSRSREVSETGGHSSLDHGICSYFYRGVSVDTDGKMLTCGYAGETASLLPHVLSIRTTEDFLKHYAGVQARFMEFADGIGYRPTCPLRDEHYLRFVSKFNTSPFRIFPPSRE